MIEPDILVDEDGEIVKYGNYRVGDLVLMCPIPEEPNEPQERLVLLAFDVLEWGVSVTGQVPEMYRSRDDRDGLRDFTLDQIERKL